VSKFNKIATLDLKEDEARTLHKKKDQFLEEGTHETEGHEDRQ
jgi:hypothetical protein